MSIKKIIFILFAIGMISFFARHYWYSFSPKTLTGLDLSSITAELCDCVSNCNKPMLLDRKNLANIIRESQKLKGTIWTGFKGEAWKTIYTIRITTGTGPAYRIELTTRDSLKGEVLASFQRESENSVDYYGYYSANDFYRLVDSVAHNHKDAPDLNPVR